MQGDTALADLEPLSKSAGRARLRSVGTQERSVVRYRCLEVRIVFSQRSQHSPGPAELLGGTHREDQLDPGQPSPTLQRLTASSAKSGLSSSAKAWSKTAMDGEGQPYSITLIKVAQDTKGNWWGRVVTQPKGDFERLQFWAKYTNGKWQGAVQDTGAARTEQLLPVIRAFQDGVLALG